MASSTREENVYMSKLAEQAERYEEMVEFMEKVVNSLPDGEELSVEERNLISVAYKNVVGSRRASWRIVSSIEQKEEGRGAADRAAAARDYRSRIESELSSICAGILKLLESRLVPSSATADSKVFYYKMKGDYHRYLAEFKSGDERKEAAESTLSSYKTAQDIAAAELPPTHPIRLGLALNFSVFYYEILNSPDRACNMAKQYHNEMQHTGVQATKYVYMALINAYANFGKFEKAKQVIRDAGIPYRYLNEIKSVFVSALSSNGQMSEALLEYDEMKQAGDKLEPKAAISLIENLQNEGNLDRLQQLLDELIDSSYWFDGCSRAVLYCVRHNLARPAIELLEELKKKDESSTYIVINQVFSGIWSNEPTNLEIGLELLRAIKEELHLCVDRISLDFLLSTCVKAKDPLRAQLVWSEYEDAGLPYNILTLLRMYQALLASGDIKAASNILKRITKDDPHVRYIIESCKATYCTKYSSKEMYT